MKNNWIRRHTDPESDSDSESDSESDWDAETLQEFRNSMYSVIPWKSGDRAAAYSDAG